MKLSEIEPKYAARQEQDIQDMYRERYGHTIMEFLQEQRVCDEFHEDCIILADIIEE